MEIQCLVLVSFSLQVFLLFSAGFRKRYRLRVLSVLLWLAYLWADHVAVFVLGLLALHPGDQLVLFWAPLLLLHLGGQETITAFSMEDCALWKRHLLNLTTQMALAIYVVGKQWRGNKQLVAPMVLMFISATIKYAERTCALWRAASWAPGSSLEMGTGNSDTHPPDENLALMFSAEDSKENSFERLMEAVDEKFQDVMEIFMDVKVKSLSGRLWVTSNKVAIVKWFTSSEDGAKLAYKLTDIHLSLIHDYLYTKFGNLKAVFYQLTTLVLTSTALTLFFVARPRVELGGYTYRYSGADVTISYILLVGAVTLEISSIFKWLMSSHWPYLIAISYLGGRRRSRASQCVGRILLSIVKRLRPGELESSKLKWSGKLHQYNMLDECIQYKQPVSCWQEQMMRRVGIKQVYTVEHIVVSPEVKDVLLEKLCETATTPDCAEKVAFNSFHGEWAAAWAARQKVSSSSKFGSAAQRLVRKSAAAQFFRKKSAAQQTLEYSHIKDMDIVPSALVWHLVTDMCLVDDQTPTNRFRICSQQLSNYIMYLVAQCKLMLNSEGHAAIEEVQYMMARVCGIGDNKRRFIRRIRDGDLRILPLPMQHQDFGRLIADRVTNVSSELLKSEAAGYRWELIAMVWVEMLFYIARNSGSGFHAKQLSAGGEFLTHAKLLMFLLLRGDGDDD